MKECPRHDLQPRRRARRRSTSSSSSSSGSSSSSSSFSRKRRHHRGGESRYRRSHSRRRRYSRKRHRSPSCVHSSSMESSGDNRSPRRSHSRWRRGSSGSRRSGTATALLNSEPFSVRADQSVLEHPETDWVCGVCSNPNSVKREDCFRCGTRFAVSVNATPSEEVKISGLPSDATFVNIQRALEDCFREHGDTFRIVGYSMDECEARNDEERKGAAYILFESVAEATKALTYARSLLVVGQSMCAMEFSLQRRVSKKSTPETKRNEKTTTVQSVDGLPEQLQPSVWRPVEHFSSPAEEKEYLDMLSRHWDKLSQEQKDYYDEGVRKALAAQRRKQQETNTAAAATVKETADSVTVSPSNTRTSLDSIKRRLAEKKEAAQNAPATAEGTAVKEHTKPTASLKERLAMKKAQLSSVAKVSGGAETESATVPSTATVTPHNDTAPAAVHSFFGFPIPSRFPTKTDYLTNSRSPSFRAGLMLRYVPPAVAERIVPPSARPPPA